MESVEKARKQNSWQAAHIRKALSGGFAEHDKEREEEENEEEGEGTLEKEQVEVSPLLLRIEEEKEETESESAPTLGTANWRVSSARMAGEGDSQWTFS